MLDPDPATDRAGLTDRAFLNPGGTSRYDLATRLPGNYDQGATVHTGIRPHHRCTESGNGSYPAMTARGKPTQPRLT